MICETWCFTTELNADSVNQIILLKERINHEQKKTLLKVLLQTACRLKKLKHRKRCKNQK